MFLLLLIPAFLVKSGGSKLFCYHQIAVRNMTGAIPLPVLGPDLIANCRKRGRAKREDKAMFVVPGYESMLKGDKRKESYHKKRKRSKRKARN